MAKLSQSSVPLIATTAFATIWIGFGINAFLRPEHALSFFELPIPTSAEAKNTVEALMAVYGIRDIFMGLALYVGAYYGDRKSLGLITVAGSAVAFADGFICKSYAGKGEWGHWGYAPMLTIAGSVLLGLFDRA